MSDEIIGIKGWTYSSRLQTDASRIKRDALSDKGQWLSGFVWGAFVVTGRSKYVVREKEEADIHLEDFRGL